MERDHNQFLAVCSKIFIISVRFSFIIKVNCVDKGDKELLNIVK